MSFDLVALKDEQPVARSARPRRSLDLETESFVRVLPIRWRLLSIGALNATVAVMALSFALASPSNAFKPPEAGELATSESPRFGRDDGGRGERLSQRGDEGICRDHRFL